VLFVLTAIEARFRAPARLGNLLHVTAQMIEARGARMVAISTLCPWNFRGSSHVAPLKSTPTKWCNRRALSPKSLKTAAWQSLTLIGAIRMMTASVTPFISC
jgi:hypothetical protein